MILYKNDNNLKRLASTNKHQVLNAERCLVIYKNDTFQGTYSNTNEIDLS